MTNKDILKIAMEQSAIDYNCSIEAFTEDRNTIVGAKLITGRKSCYTHPLFCRMAYYGHGLVISVDEKMREYITEFAQRHQGYRCFDTPQLIALNHELERYGKCICHIAEFFLPDRNKQTEINTDLEIRILYEEDIPTLYTDKRFSMALTYDTDEVKKDVIAAVGYHNGQIVGVAGASNDCDTMWQVGIDVIPEFRNRGIASSLTKCLTDEILSLGKVPYYCTAWSNLASKNNAIRSGYRSAWVEMAAKDISVAMDMINEPLY